MIDSGKENFCLESFSTLPGFTLSINVRLKSFSISDELIEDTSGQNKMLNPEGKSEVSHVKSLF